MPCHNESTLEGGRKLTRLSTLAKQDTELVDKINNAFILLPDYADENLKELHHSNWQSQ